MPSPIKENPNALKAERRRQIRGLTFLALAIVLFAVLRAGLPQVFTSGWWRVW